MLRKIFTLSMIVSTLAMPAWAESDAPPLDAAPVDESAMTAPIPTPTPTATEAATTMHWQVRGLDALHATELEGALKTINGVSTATVDWKPGTVEVQCAAACPTAVIQQVLTQSGTEIIVR